MVFTRSLFHPIRLVFKKKRDKDPLKGGEKVTFCGGSSSKMAELKFSTCDGLTLLNIVGSTSLFSPKTSLFFFNDDEISNMLNQQRWAI